MRVQVIQHHADQYRVRKVDVHQIFHTLCKVQRRALLSDLDVSPASERLEEQEQIATAPAQQARARAFR